MAMYFQILNVIGPVFLMTFVGYVLARRQIPLDPRTLSSLVLLVATPSLVFSTLTSLTIDLATMSDMALAAGLSVAVAAALATPETVARVACGGHGGSRGGCRPRICQEHVLSLFVCSLLLCSPALASHRLMRGLPTQSARARAWAVCFWLARLV